MGKSIINSNLESRLAQAIETTTGVSAEKVLELLCAPKNPEFGDVAFPTFQLAKNRSAPPPEVAKTLATELGTIPGIREIVATGPYLNFKFEREIVVGDILSEALNPKAEDYFSEPRQHYLVEYSCPNIAKPFHVGHLRNTLIGGVIDRLFRIRGHKVTSLNYLGDWGTQFGFVWAGCKLFGEPESFTVHNLVQLYKKASALAKRQSEKSLSSGEESFPDVTTMAREYFIKLEQRASEEHQFWKRCLDTTTEFLDQIYPRIKIKFDVTIGESDYSDKTDKVVREFRSLGLLTGSQGALGVDLGDELGFVRFVTPDGRALYMARDVATADDRFLKFNYDRCFYVVAVQQNLHFKQLFGVLAAAKKPFAERLEHLSYGMVLGMSTRGGEVVEIGTLLDEAEERALTAYHEQVTKRPEDVDEKSVAKAVALAAIGFSVLSRTRARDIEFSWEEALKFTGSSGPYLLYAYARISSLKEKAAAIGLAPSAEFSCGPLVNDAAYRLAVAIGKLKDVLAKAEQEREPAIICHYAIEIAQTFSHAYQELPVIGEEKTTAFARLCLFEATQRTLRCCLDILGFTPLERM